MDTRKDENELHLLGGSTVYKQDYAPEVLEAFTNKHPDNDYWVRFNCPESQIHRSNRYLHSARRNQHLPVLQLRPAGH